MPHEEDVSLKTILSEDLETKNNACPTCDKSFSFTTNITRHMKIHSNEKLYTCDTPDTCDFLSKDFWEERKFFNKYFVKIY